MNNTTLVDRRTGDVAMKSRLLCLLAGPALIASISVAQAGEPTVLGESQMDNVTAGYTINVKGPNNYTLALDVVGQELAKGQSIIVNSGTVSFDSTNGVFVFTPSSANTSTTSTIFMQPDTPDITQGAIKAVTVSGAGTTFNVNTGTFVFTSSSANASTTSTILRANPVKPQP